MPEEYAMGDLRRCAEVRDAWKCVMHRGVWGRRAFGGSGKRWSSEELGWYPLGLVCTVGNVLNA